MKTVSLLFICSVGFQISIFSQVDTSIKSEKDFYVAHLKSVSKATVKGSIIELKDSSVVFSKFINPTTTKIFEIDVTQIEKIKFRKKGHPGIGKCTLYGFAAGIGIGAILGFASGGDGPNEFIIISAGEKALLGSILFGLVGTTVGACIGTFGEIEIPIKGKLSKYKLKKQEMERFKY